MSAIRTRRAGVWGIEGTGVFKFGVKPIWDAFKGDICPVSSARSIVIRRAGVAVGSWSFEGEANGVVAIGLIGLVDRLGVDGGCSGAGAEKTENVCMPWDDATGSLRGTGSTVS